MAFPRSSFLWALIMWTKCGERSPPRFKSQASLLMPQSNCTLWSLHEWFWVIGSLGLDRPRVGGMVKQKHGFRCILHAAPWPTRDISLVQNSVKEGIWCFDWERWVASQNPLASGRAGQWLISSKSPIGRVGPYHKEGLPKLCRCCRFIGGRSGACKNRTETDKINLVIAWTAQC